MVDLFRQRKWDLVGRRNIWFAISFLIIAPGVFFWATRGLNYGIDFTGGGLITYKLAAVIPQGQESATLAKARAAVGKTGIDTRVQLAGTATAKDQILVRTRRAERNADDVLEEQQLAIHTALNEAFPDTRTVATDMVTAVVSKELLANAVWSVIAGMGFVLLWVWARYQGWRWGSCALVALVHDVLVIIGVFAITQREVNSPFVAAALTVVGFSVHDTIVIFDRIRENVRLRKGATFAETANISLLETMARSVNTVLTTELVLIAIYLLGGASLRDFTFAMIVGVTVGAYSSIFNASQLLVVLRNRQDSALARRRALTGRTAARRPARALPSQPSAPAPNQAETAAPADAEPPEAEPAAKAPPSARERAARAPRGARKKLKAGRKRKKRF